MKKKVKKNISKEAILRVATEEFADKGLNGARIEVIADRAKVNQAMIYYHYGCKDKLYEHSIKNMAEGVFSNVWPEFPAAWNLNLPEKMYLTMYYFVRYQLTIVDPQFTRLIAWDLAENNNFLRTVVQSYFTPLVQKFTDVLQQGIDAGELSTDQPHMFAHLFFSALAWHKLRRDTPTESDIFDTDYGENGIEKFSDFFIEYSLKALSPGEKVLQPVIVPEHVQYVQAMLTAKVRPGVVSE